MDPRNKSEDDGWGEERMRVTPLGREDGAIGSDVGAH
ncbi:MAG: hypothetical protein ACJAXQ_000007 [Parvibaculaceae bacterium]|jgi:hypothetical protein